MMHVVDFVCCLAAMRGVLLCWVLLGLGASSDGFQVLLSTGRGRWNSRSSPPSTALKAPCGRHGWVGARPWRGLRLAMQATEGDGDDDGSTNGPSPEDWRKFRAALIENGLKTTEDGEGEGGGVAAGEGGKERRVVSVGNEELLKQQSPELAEEYFKGVWAHETAEPEIGGLLCRLPIEFQLFHGVPSSSDALAPTLWGNIVSARLQKEAGAGLDTDDEADLRTERFSSFRANTAYMYRLTAGMIQEKLDSLIEGGVLQPERVSRDEAAMDLIANYAEYQDAWQEVVLLLNSSFSQGTRGVVINRPLAAGVDARMGALLLLGRDAPSAGEGGRMRVRRFVEAFGSKGVVYRGGPDELDARGFVVHGVEGLDGAREISPGTGIYVGGESAAVEAVLEGRCQPLDFRWFIGCRRWAPGGLEEKVRAGKYQAMASARSVALKQCIALPKPLWHEVMELGGGRSRELSLLEIQKRDDLSEEERGG